MDEVPRDQGDARFTHERPVHVLRLLQWPRSPRVSPRRPSTDLVRSASRRNSRPCLELGTARDARRIVGQQAHGSAVIPCRPRTVPAALVVAIVPARSSAQGLGSWPAWPYCRVAAERPPHRPAALRFPLPRTRVARRRERLASSAEPYSSTLVAAGIQPSREGHVRPWRNVE